MHSSRLMRARINQRLERASRFPVTLIVAPAGFGKTVALRDFIETARLNVLKYDVRRDDGSLLAFVRRLSETLEQVAPTALAAFASMQERVLAADEPVRQLSDWFVEHLKSVECTIVIDDLHYAATDPASIALLADVIERTGEHIRWIIAARSDVGLPVATWIAYGRMDLPVGEDELRFTIDEALAAADETQSEIDPQEIEALRQLTEGWPVALTIALRTRTHSADLRSASSGTREMVYRYLAEQIFARLSPEQRSFALSTSVFTAFDSGIVADLGWSLESLAALRARVAFLNEIAPGEFRYHDLFRDFLETELRRLGESAWSQALHAGAALLEKRGDHAGALVLYTKARATADLSRLIRASGFSLFERGESEHLAAAIEAIPDEMRRTDATLLGLEATIEAGRGRFELAEPRFLAAIEKSGADQAHRSALAARYAIELVRHGRDCVAFLEPYAKDESLDKALRIPLLGTLATAYAGSGRRDLATVTIERALQMLDPSMNNELPARLYQQAAYVYHFGPSFERAKKYAKLAIDLALRQNLYEVAARAYSALYTVAYNETSNPLECLSILERLDECARKAASLQAHLYVLITSYEIEVERADDDALQRLDAALRENESALPHVRSEAFLPADALRAAWSGDFARAFRLLENTAADLSESDRRTLRWSEIALYAFAAGLHDEGNVAVHEWANAMQACKEPSRRTIRSHVFMALAEMVRGHSSAAHRHLTEADRAIEGPMTRMRALVSAVRTVHRVQLGQAESSGFANALERLRAEQFGGIARLLESIALPGGSADRYGALTPAEREILQLLARGASTKDVAAQTGRSPHTVDTHIRSICKKLECGSRREAVALATTAGWVHA
jgi:LuxR family maltose regulon positive regulatory protein